MKERTGGEPLKQGPAEGTGRVCVCLLNWNGWRDTIECLESLLRVPRPALQVLVLDNGSTDDSLVHLRLWAQGRSGVEFETPGALRSLVSPAIPKPVAFREYARHEIEALVPAAAPDEPLLLIRNGANLGFAGGLNVGLRYALRVGRFEYVWLLNNDTVVQPRALEQLVDRMEGDPRLGLCGSTLLFYDEPELVQALGGFTYNVWLGLASQIGQMQRHAELSPERVRGVERSMFGVQGASVLVSIPFLRRVGLLAEDYFLYFEEQDWAARARREGFGIGYAPQSVVYHKEGRSTGNHSRTRHHRSPASDYYQIQARLVFTRKFFPYALPVVYLGLLGVLLNRLRRGQLRRAGMIARLALRMLLSPAARRLGSARSAALATGEPRTVGR